ncbi:MAG: lipid-A-disaccharide synthase [Candidatus Aminicenantales bacterium]
MTTHTLFIVAGEKSGENYGANLVRQFKKRWPSSRFFGIGGSGMEAEGVEILFPMEDLAVVGVVEILSHLPRIRRIYHQLIGEVKRRKPSAAVLIDSPDFNLRLAKRLKKISVPVLYYISPTVWAWRPGRLKTIKKNVAKMLLIFPFEEGLYREKEIPARYIGHPLLERIHVTLDKEAFAQKYGLDPQKKIITLLPGSRRSEIRFHMPVLVRAVEKLHRALPCQFLLVLAGNPDSDFLNKTIPPGLNDFKILTEDGYAAMASSDLILSACGTANLEAALLGTPFISFYRISPLTYYAGVRLVKISHFSIVNILAGTKIIPELIQRRFTAENVFQEARTILNSKQIQDEMKSNLGRIRALLGEAHASENAAQELDRLIHSS